MQVLLTSAVCQQFIAIKDYQDFAVETEIHEAFSLSVTVVSHLAISFQISHIQTQHVMKNISLK